MGKIIKKVKTKRGYCIGKTEITILCYANDVVLFAENKNDLQD